MRNFIRGMKIWKKYQLAILKCLWWTLQLSQHSQAKNQWTYMLLEIMQAYTQRSKILRERNETEHPRAIRQYKCSNIQVIWIPGKEVRMGQKKYF